MHARKLSGNFEPPARLIPLAPTKPPVTEATDPASGFKIEIANIGHIFWAQEICDEMLSSAIARGTGISKRTPQSIQQKMKQGEAIIAFSPDGKWAGFSYISAWENGKFVSNSGLIVAPEFRKSGIARKIKEMIFDLSRGKYPQAKIFSLTSGLAVMKMNHQLGFEPVTYAELPTDDAFWEGCKSCVNCPILMSKGRKNCLCTALLFDPETHRPAMSHNNH